MSHMLLYPRGMPSTHLISNDISADAIRSTAFVKYAMPFHNMCWHTPLKALRAGINLHRQHKHFSGGPCTLLPSLRSPSKNAQPPSRGLCTDIPRQFYIPNIKSGFQRGFYPCPGNFWWVTGRHWKTLPAVIAPGYSAPGARCSHSKTEKRHLPVLSDSALLRDAAP